MQSDTDYIMPIAMIPQNDINVINPTSSFGISANSPSAITNQLPTVSNLFGGLNVCNVFKTTYDIQGCTVGTASNIYNTGPLLGYGFLNCYRPTMTGFSSQMTSSFTSLPSMNPLMASPLQIPPLVPNENSTINSQFGNPPNQFPHFQPNKSSLPKPPIWKPYECPDTHTDKTTNLLDTNHNNLATIQLAAKTQDTNVHCTNQQKSLERSPFDQITDLLTSDNQESNEVNKNMFGTGNNTIQEVAEKKRRKHFKLARFVENIQC